MLLCGFEVQAIASFVIKIEVYYFPSANKSITHSVKINIEFFLHTRFTKCVSLLPPFHLFVE